MYLLDGDEWRGFFLDFNNYKATELYRWVLFIDYFSVKFVYSIELKHMVKYGYRRFNQIITFPSFVDQTCEIWWTPTRVFVRPCLFNKMVKIFLCRFDSHQHWKCFHQDRLNTFLDWVVDLVYIDEWSLKCPGKRDSILFLMDWFECKLIDAMLNSKKSM